ncbi:YceD family protein [Oricola indica]|jgi:uncharacterized metal-binding protein YceD (DUF177 family)|uniref:YceD family protein n=1 Tax=Oricola indica TaxID=2872591 RepID=UPI001CC07CC7|nr:DUF177 domain-containing protein [Oricola indica]
MAGSDKKQSPVSHTVVVSVLPSAGFSARIEATEDQKAALAEAHDLLAVDSFIAELELKRWRRDGVRIRGNVQARIRQECVVTLEPLVTDLDVPVDAVFLPEGSKLARPLDEEGALIVDPDGPDLPEIFEGGVIDAGAVAEEFFALDIDPYPRAPGAEMEAEEGDGEDASEKPFAGLAALRDKL